MTARDAPASRMRGTRRRRILELLREAGGRRSVPGLLQDSGASRSVLRALERLGLIALESHEAPRRPAAFELPLQTSSALNPTPGQRAAIETIEGALASRSFTTFLLHGVTGSGKTEVYMRAIEATIRGGRKALYLVPEIGLTPLLARRMRSRFGEVLGLLHSGLGDGERYDEWRRIRDGRVEVVLGARSAVFAPIPDVGLVVVDEEHDTSYKQDEHPRYNGRDLAIMRAKMSRAVVVLGSATPSMETYLQARRGRYRSLGLPGRIGPAGLRSDRHAARVRGGRSRVGPVAASRLRPGGAPAAWGAEPHSAESPRLLDIRVVPILWRGHPVPELQHSDDLASAAAASALSLLR